MLPCRKKKAVHKTTSTDDKRLQVGRLSASRSILAGCSIAGGRQPLRVHSVAHGMTATSPGAGPAHSLAQAAGWRPRAGQVMRTRLCQTCVAGPLRVGAMQAAAVAVVAGGIQRGSPARPLYWSPSHPASIGPCCTAPLPLHALLRQAGARALAGIDCCVCFKQRPAAPSRSPPRP